MKVQNSHHGNLLFNLEKKKKERKTKSGGNSNVCELVVC